LDIFIWFLLSSQPLSLAAPVCDLVTRSGLAGHMRVVVALLFQRGNFALHFSQTVSVARIPF
jgi:hypothetical protein